MAIRSCIICGEKEDKYRLLRLVCSAGTLEVDFGQILAGRGFYIHLKEICLTKVDFEKIKKRIMQKMQNYHLDISSFSEIDFGKVLKDGEAILKTESGHGNKIFSRGFSQLETVKNLISKKVTIRNDVNPMRSRMGFSNNCK